MPGASSGSRMERRSEEPQSTLIAFPRVGRSVPDQEYFMSGDESSPEELDASPLKASPDIGKRTRLHTRASKGSMMAFPRVGKRQSPTYPKILPLLERHFANSASREWSNDQGILINTLYVILMSGRQKQLISMVDVTCKMLEKNMLMVKTEI